MNYKHLIFISIIFVFTSCTTNKYLAPVVNKNESYMNKNSISRTINVYAGDSLYAISKREGVSIRSIIKANNLKPPFILYEGDKLTIPVSKVYIVKKGNTLWDIAKCYGVSANSIRSINNLKVKDKIFEGKKIFIPINNYNVNIECEGLIKEKRNIKNRDKKSKITNNRNDKDSINLTYLWPVKGKIVSNYGLLAKGLRNDGINISANKGDPVFAVESGKIVYAGNEIQAFGNLILIKHSDNKTTAYAHLEKIKVKKGQIVKKGQVIASLGNSGKVSLPQLHFEVRDVNGPLDPLKYLP